MDYIMGKDEVEEGEVKLWTVATGHFPSLFASRDLKRRSKKAIDYINRLDGFCGLHPMPQGTLCLFESENDAKAARNLMRSKGIPVGDNICYVFAPKEVVEQMKEKIRKYNAKKG